MRLHGSVWCLRSAGDPHLHGRKRCQTFLSFLSSKIAVSLCFVIMHNFTNSMCIFFAGLTRTATKIGGDLLPHPQTPFTKTELRLDSFLSRHCSFSVPPVLHPNCPCVTTPSTIATIFASTGAPHHDSSKTPHSLTQTSSRGSEEGWKKK